MRRMTPVSSPHASRSPHDPAFRAPLLASRWAVLGVLALELAGCALFRRPGVPVEDRGTAASASAPAPASAAPAGAPGESKPAATAPVATYTVKRGDTLYQIALDNGLDYRELAAWNNIENVNRIYVGQVLRMAAPGEAATAAAGGSPEGVTTAPLRTAPPVAETRPPAAPGTPAAPSVAAGGNLKTAPKAIKEPYSDQAVRDLTLAATAVPAPPGETVRPAPVTSGPAPASTTASAAPPITP